MGLMSKYVIEVYALSGVVVRANDFRKDLRLVGYSYYSRIEFNVVVGIKGDSMDRYLVRMNESLESVKTLNKCIRTLTTWYLSYTEVYGHVLTFILDGLPSCTTMRTLSYTLSSNIM